MEGSPLKRKKLCDIENEDKISNLPDSVLTHILCFLPTICSVRSSCLSRRWRYLWTSLPALDLSDTYYASQIKPCNATASIRSFSNFVNRVLILCACPCLQSFFLSLTSNFYSTFDVESWIWAAIFRNVEKLHLNTSTKVEIPQILFNSEKLVNLGLGSNIDLNVPMFVNLPSLKTLLLFHVHSLSDASIKWIILGCPTLEHLAIKRSNQDSIHTLSILSSSLKCFQFRSRMKIQGENPGNNCSIIIDAPNLKTLVLEDTVSRNNDIELRNISSLSTANLVFFHCRANLPQFCGTRMVQILKNRNIKVLSSVMFTLLKALVDTSNNKFLCCSNMKCLTVVLCGAEMKILPDILSSFLNLQVLRLAYLVGNHAVAYEDMKENKSEIHCFNYSLKKIEFCNFRGKEADMRMAEYFLKNAKVLHEMRFTCTKVLENEVEVLKKLLEFPRSSGACKIDVVVC